MKSALISAVGKAVSIMIITVGLGTHCFAQTVSLSRTTGPPTTIILVSGGGFRPDSPVDIYFDKCKRTQAQTNSSGAFGPARMTIPAEALPGRHLVNVLQGPVTVKGHAPFLVRTNWPQFHADANRSGFNPYENVVNPKNVASLRLKWSYITAGGVSSPAIADGSVYISDGYGVYALDADTGSLRWSYSSGGSSSPAVSKNTVYVSTAEGVLALNAKTGLLLWKSDIANASLPAVPGTNVYVGSQGYVYALDAESGAILWKSQQFAYLDYFNLSVANGKVYVVSDVYYSSITNKERRRWRNTTRYQPAAPYYADIVALDSTTGKLVWSFVTYEGDWLQGAVAVVNGVVYAGSYNDWSGAYRYALNADTGAVLWAVSTRAMNTTPAVVSGIGPNGVVYMVDIDGVDAFDAATGRQFYSGCCGGGTPAVANGVVYVNNNAVDATTGTLLWQFDPGVDQWWWSSPAIANGLLYMGSTTSYSGGGVLYALSLP